MTTILNPPSPTPTPTPLRPNLLRTIRINKLINDFPIAARLTKFKVYKARILDCALEPDRHEALSHCFYYLAVKPTLVRVKSRSAL